MTLVCVKLTKTNWYQPPYPWPLSYNPLSTLSNLDIPPQAKSSRYLHHSGLRLHRYDKHQSLSSPSWYFFRTLKSRAGTHYILTQSLWTRGRKRSNVIKGRGREGQERTGKGFSLCIFLSIKLRYFLPGYTSSSQIMGIYQRPSLEDSRQHSWVILGWGEVDRRRERGD